MLEAAVQDRILAPASEVRDAIVNPERMSGYFISHGDKPMRSGTSVHWEFADVGGALDVDVLEVDDDRIRFHWEASGVRTLVDLEMLPDDATSTVVKVTESGWPNDDDGVARALEQRRVGPTSPVQLEGLRIAWHQPARGSHGRHALTARQFAAKGKR